VHSEESTRGPLAHTPRSKRLPLSVMLVEPNAQRAEEIAHSLPQPARITYSPSAEAALATIPQQRPALIITAYDLPGLSALEFIAQLHAAPATRDVLVMVVTPHATIRHKIAALRAGADDYVVMPLNPGDFAVRVRLLSRFLPSLR
jgi:DNA-binding response OmpR family regulator